MSEYFSEGFKGHPSLGVCFAFFLLKLILGGGGGQGYGVSTTCRTISNHFFVQLRAHVARLGTASLIGI